MKKQNPFTNEGLVITIENGGAIMSFSQRPIIYLRIFIQKTHTPKNAVTPGQSKNKNKSYHFRIKTKKGTPLIRGAQISFTGHA